MKNEAELSPERYRELAVKALQRAQAAKTQTERRYFIEQATIWQRLADAGFNDAARHNFRPRSRFPRESQKRAD